MPGLNLKDRTLGLYIHIPFCLSKCSYCDFFSLPVSKKVPDSYIEALCNEISAAFENQENVTVNSLYIGGGTPSLLSENQIKKLFDHLRHTVSLEENCEVTVEINPDDVTKSLLECLQEAGVNRLSCGIQSLNDSSLSFCGRRADSSVNKKALSLIKDFWTGRLSLDLICGLPEENKESFIQGLEFIISLRPEHISMYSLTIEEETVLGRQLSSGFLSYDFDFADELWLCGRDCLEKAGYHHYEVSNFCLEGNECLHNLKYWSRMDYLGFGAGATGTLYFPGGRAERRTNLNDTDRYIKYWTSFSSENLPYFIEDINEESGEFEFFMMSLRKIQGFSENEYKKHFLKALPAKVIEEFQKWRQKGLAEICHENNDVFFTLGKNGIIYLNSFLKELL
ncbi:MAG: radical SAM family heme chaperone HemW [Treponema sp.]|nr:radical SAM family heme chaperone HemW [Treponema sp.]